MFMLFLKSTATNNMAGQFLVSFWIDLTFITSIHLKDKESFILNTCLTSRIMKIHVIRENTKLFFLQTLTNSVQRHSLFYWNLFKWGRGGEGVGRVWGKERSECFPRDWIPVAFYQFLLSARTFTCHLCLKHSQGSDYEKFNLIS